jgi:predicted acyltransferase (DUF342 family)
MKYTKQIVAVMVLLGVGAGLTVWSNADAASSKLLSGTLNEQTIYANTYVTVGAASANKRISGHVLANQAVTIGAGGQIGGTIRAGAAVNTGDSATVTGDVVSGAASTIGANSIVSGNLYSGAAVTLGANSQVEGTVEYAAGITNGDGSTSGTQMQNTIPPVIEDEHLLVITAQSALDAMLGVIVTDSAILTNTRFTAGVHDVPGYLTTAAGVTVTLDAQGKDGAFIFNIGTYMTLGEGTVIEVLNGTPNTTVIWNVTDGYANIGANTAVVGTILAEQYVTIGADSTVTGAGTSCGGLYSGLSYVTLGANTSVSVNDCSGGAINHMLITDGVAHYQTPDPGEEEEAPQLDFN